MQKKEFVVFVFDVLIINNKKQKDKIIVVLLFVNEVMILFLKKLRCY